MTPVSETRAAASSGAAPGIRVSDTNAGAGHARQLTVPGDELDADDHRRHRHRRPHLPLTRIKAGKRDTDQGYFETNGPRTRCKHLRSHSLFAGSGAVKSGCKAGRG